MFIYLITNQLNGKTYVGQTIRDPKDRWYRHCSTNPGNMRIGNAIKKNGKENFTFEVVDSASSLEELDNKEQEWIAAKNSIRNGYNSTYGGNKCHNQTEESNEKRSAKLKGISKPTLRKPFICVNTGKEYQTLADCAKEIDCEKASISKVLNGNRNNVYGLTFKYKEI